MKLFSGVISPAPARGQNASAVLIVLILLALVAALVISNGRVLYHLQQEIRLLDRRQQQRLEKQFAPPRARPTNEVERLIAQPPQPKPSR